ncbi:hypothetical protein VLK31_07085 [Variovorax sp. H27-G14]|uniref:hypothetical protein n=1 Tax=Variovorax sp. H27-G14 TaxID=3111914 RepID=UPI0038FC7AE2
MYLKQASDSIAQSAVRASSQPQPLRDTPPVAAELNELSMALNRLDATWQVSMSSWTR